MPEEQSTITPENGEVILSWQTPEHLPQPRGKWWYIISGAVLVLLIIFALVTKNFLFAMLVLLFAAVVLMGHSRQPAILDCAVTAKGIQIGSGFYPYENLKSYWIVEEPVKSVYFDFHGVRPSLSAYLLDRETQEVREALAEFLAEDKNKKEEPLTDTFWRLLKL